jgi:hypothetical protein
LSNQSAPIPEKIEAVKQAITQEVVLFSSVGTMEYSENPRSGTRNEQMLA